MITTAQVGTTVKFAGYYADPWVFTALGATSSYPYSNNADGRVDFGGGWIGSQAQSRALALLATARAALGDSASDEQVLTEAMRQYRAEETMLALPNALNNLASALRSGHVTHEHRHAVAVLVGGLTRAIES